MLKQFIGDDISGKFSEEIALRDFMGWDQDRIEENKRKRFQEAIENAKIKWIAAQVEKNGTTNLEEYFQDINQKDLNSLTDISQINSKSSNSESGGEGGDTSNETNESDNETDEGGEDEEGGLSL